MISVSHTMYVVRSRTVGWPRLPACSRWCISCCTRPGSPVTLRPSSCPRTPPHGVSLTEWTEEPTSVIEPEIGSFPRVYNPYQ
ncbi:hypothetical protein STCU_10640 [Strigomonas culicis]|uniref:Uncharacterized protein n=1 Tax=Strigomonas culicis TaxID=28005 RepID=S9TM12_9TRYP|nr:hypothetical protein STCU_10640 [Strigomonas culicis]|eukprot:EPY17403.1 hypothetical protein STCU_10640 [Strigomonas culicis]